MTREIKFRAWDKEHNAMLPCVPVEAVSVGRWLEMTGTTLNLMQFTGLRDKNGKEIYEGDVVRVTNVENQINFGKPSHRVERAVQWGEFGWMPFALCGSIDCEYTFKADTAVVIGNIYEHPDLLTPTL